MKPDIGQLQKSEEPEWDRYVVENNETTFYHQAGWKNIIEKTYGHRPLYFVARDKSGRICGILPLFMIRTTFKKQFVSVPFAPYGGPCSDNETIDNLLIKAAIDAGKALGISRYELRNLSHKTYPDFTQIDDYYSTFILDLSTDPDQLWKNLGKNVKGGVKKGISSNLSYNIDQSMDAVANFHKIYALTMSRLGSPSHGLAFFKQIKEQFPEDIYISTVKHDDSLISTLLMLKFKTGLISGWGASLQEYFRYSPNNFNYWRSIQFACEKGCLSFDFGRSTVNSGNYNFKKFWGAHNIPLTYSYYPHLDKTPLSGSHVSVFSKIWKNIPYSIAKIMGPIVRKNIP